MELPLVPIQQILPKEQWESTFKPYSHLQKRDHDEITPKYSLLYHLEAIVWSTRMIHMGGLTPRQHRLYIHYQQHLALRFLKHACVTMGPQSPHTIQTIDRKTLIHLEKTLEQPENTPTDSVYLLRVQNTILKLLRSELWKWHGDTPRTKAWTFTKSDHAFLVAQRDALLREEEDHKAFTQGKLAETGGYPRTLVFLECGRRLGFNPENFLANFRQWGFGDRQTRRESDKKLSFSPKDYARLLSEHYQSLHFIVPANEPQVLAHLTKVLRNKITQSFIVPLPPISGHTTWRPTPAYKRSIDQYKQGLKKIGEVPHNYVSNLNPNDKRTEEKDSPAPNAKVNAKKRNPSNSLVAAAKRNKKMLERISEGVEERGH